MARGTVFKRESNLWREKQKTKKKDEEGERLQKREEKGKKKEGRGGWIKEKVFLRCPSEEGRYFYAVVLGMLDALPNQRTHCRDTQIHTLTLTHT